MRGGGSSARGSGAVRPCGAPTAGVAGTKFTMYVFDGRLVHAVAARITTPASAT
jgi:hypothetical protein